MVEIKLKEIHSLVPLESNPRKITNDQFKNLCNDIQKDPDFFFNRPCLVHLEEDGTFRVYAGNQRLQAAKKLGWKQVPCIIESGLSEDIIKERIIKDNLHRGDWDWDVLGNEWDEDLLISAGMKESDLIGPIDDFEDDSVKDFKKKKLKQCPECGCEF